MVRKNDYHTTGKGNDGLDHLRFYIVAGSSDQYSGLYRDQQHSSFSGSLMDSSTH